MDDEMEILSNLMDYFLGNEEENQDQDQDQDQYDDIPALERIGDSAPANDTPSYNTPSNAAPSYPYEDEYLHINRDELIIVFD